MDQISVCEATFGPFWFDLDDVRRPTSAAAGAFYVQSRYFVMMNVRSALTLPWSFFVSYSTTIVNASRPSRGSRSDGTRHEYPQVPSHPNGAVPSATTSPWLSLIPTVGSRLLSVL